MSSEDGEMWREFKKYKQGCRTQRRENAPDQLRAKGIVFTEHNNGAHLILDTEMGFVDFWPGTTKWKFRSGESGYGLAKLLGRLG